MAARDKILARVRRVIKASLQAARQELAPWPTPKHSLKGQDRLFLFILTPPYSGSTALARILNTATNSMVLQERAEGQWLLQGLSGQDRIDPDKEVNWKSVEAVWLSQVEMVERLVGTMDVIIEKSPSNIVRADQLVKAFPNNKIVTFNRNPYANYSSVVYRHHSPDSKTEDERINLARIGASRWISRSTWIKRWIDQLDAVSLTYEQFCSDPQLQMKRITDMVPLNGIDVDYSIKVKDYPTQKISNQNARQIAKISEGELVAMGEVLSPHEELLQFFGYTSVWQEDMENGGAMISKESPQ